METRLQVVGDDTVLEITERKPSKQRLSLKTLTRQKQYLQESIAHFISTLAVVEAQLELIATAKHEEAQK